MSIRAANQVGHSASTYRISTSQKLTDKLHQFHFRSPRPYVTLVHDVTGGERLVTSPTHSLSLSANHGSCRR